MAQPPPPPPPAEAPVDPLFTHPASPFLRTQPPEPVAFASPPDLMPSFASTWASHKAKIQFAFSVLAYLMVVVGVGIVVQANAGSAWPFYIALLPLVPAGLVLWVIMRALARLDEVKKRIQLQALGFALGASALLAFGYGFLEGVGMPHLNWTLFLPLIVLLWAGATAVLELRQRYRRP
jgi:hypothetical protein